jgi:hypothetical protein
MSEDREIYFVQAMQEGLREAMAEDETVVVIGEDVDRSVIGATKGLIDEFGPCGCATRRSPRRRSSAPASAPPRPASSPWPTS